MISIREHTRSVLRGFKDFIMRGNAADLGVGIVIGTAFTALVKTFTTAFIDPLLKLVGANTATQQAGGTFTIHGSEFPWATFATGLITFLITAVVLYLLVVLPMNKFAERRKRGQEPSPPPDEIVLLTEIRDALRERPHD